MLHIKTRAKKTSAVKKSSRKNHYIGKHSLSLKSQDIKVRKDPRKICLGCFPLATESPLHFLLLLTPVSPTPRLSAERIHESVQTQLTSIGARQSTIHYTTQSSPYYSARRNHHCTVLRDAIITALLCTMQSSLHCSARRNHHCTVLRDAITTALFCATQLRNHIALGHFATRRNQHLRGRT